MFRTAMVVLALATYQFAGSTGRHSGPVIEASDVGVACRAMAGAISSDWMMASRPCLN